MIIGSRIRLYIIVITKPWWNSQNILLFSSFVSGVLNIPSRKLTWQMENPPWMSWYISYWTVGDFPAIVILVETVDPFQAMLEFTSCSGGTQKWQPQLVVVVGLRWDFNSSHKNSGIKTLNPKPNSPETRPQNFGVFFFGWKNFGLDSKRAALSRVVFLGGLTSWEKGP